jgi:hypothetical protein
MPQKKTSSSLTKSTSESCLKTSTYATWRRRTCRPGSLSMASCTQRWRRDRSISRKSAETRSLLIIGRNKQRSKRSGLHAKYCHNLRRQVRRTSTSVRAWRVVSGEIALCGDNLGAILRVCVWRPSLEYGMMNVVRLLNPLDGSSYL